MSGRSHPDLGSPTGTVDGPATCSSAADATFSTTIRGDRRPKDNRPGAAKGGPERRNAQARDEVVRFLMASHQWPEQAVWPTVHKVLIRAKGIATGTAAHGASGILMTPLHGHPAEAAGPGRRCCRLGSRLPAAPPRHRPRLAACR